MKHTFRTFSLFLTLICTLTGLQAKDITDERATTTFRRIAQLSEIDDYAYYAIVFPDNYQNAVAVSTTLFKQTRLLAYDVGGAAGDEVNVPVDKVAWTFKLLGNGLVEMHAVSGNGVLRRTTANDAGLSFADTPDAQCTWQIVSLGNGRFNFCEPNTGRGLSRSISGDTQYFDNFKNPPKNGFCVYRFSTRYSDQTGQARLPADGCTVTLCNEGFVPLGTGTAADATDYMLCDGQLARMPGMLLWTCEQTGGNDFALRTGADYLGYDLQPHAERAVWRITGGHVCTTETTPRYLCYDAVRHAWQVVNETDALVTALPTNVADAPQRHTADNGICYLTGGWCADALANVELADAYCLDLTEAVLPRAPRPFNQAAATANMPVFVSAGMTHCVPASWPFVVSCSASERTLLRPYTLKDREPFFTDRSFKVSAGQLTYSRPADGSWQTLCLPFTAKVTDFKAAELTAATADGTLSFADRTTIEAGHAYIVKAQGSLQVGSTAGEVAPNLSLSGALQGSFMPFEVKATADGIYLLVPQTSTFRHAAAGSRLAPFRAFLCPGSNATRAVFSF